MASNAMNTISDADIARSREDPRFKQVLLAKGLEQLLASLHRMQNSRTPRTRVYCRARLARRRLARRAACRPHRAIDDQIAHAQAG